MKYVKIVLLVIVLFVGGVYVFFVASKSGSNVVVEEKVDVKSETEEAPKNEIQKPEEGKVESVDASKATWTFERYQALMTESGRKNNISEKTFLEIQKRKLIANQIVEKYLTEKLGSADLEVLRAFNEVPREYYHYQYQNDNSIASVAYEDTQAKVKPWAIGWGSALSEIGRAHV